jgi:hypothetical protein
MAFRIRPSTFFSASRRTYWPSLATWPSLLHSTVTNPIAAAVVSMALTMRGKIGFSMLGMISPTMPVLRCLSARATLFGV